MEGIKMDIRAVEEELKKGWEATRQLRGLLLEVKEDDNNSKNNYREKESIDLEDENLLTFKNNCCSTIIKSFDTCLSILNSNLEASNNLQINSIRGDVLDQAPESQTIGNCGQINSKHTRVKTIETPNLVPDGYLWRKYGRKPIQHAQYPREYYRCTFKDDRKCPATKHIQMISNNPTMYKINYYSDHICQAELHDNNISQTQDVIDCVDEEFTNLISFETKKPTTNVPKQKLKPFVHDSSPSFGEGSISSMVTLTQESKGASTSKIIVEIAKKKEESSPTIDIDFLKKNDVVFSSLLSPSILMSPKYIMGTSFLHLEEDYGTLLRANEDEQFNHFGGALLQSQDIPLWEHGLFSS